MYIQLELLVVIKHIDNEMLLLNNLESLPLIIPKVINYI